MAELSKDAKAVLESMVKDGKLTDEDLRELGLLGNGNPGKTIQPYKLKPTVAKNEDGSIDLTFHINPNRYGEPYENSSGKKNTCLMFGTWKRSVDNRIPLPITASNGQPIVFDMKISHKAGKTK